MIESWFQIPIFYKDLDTTKIQPEVESTLKDTTIRSADNMWKDSVQTSFTYGNNNKFLETCPELASQIFNSVLEYMSVFNFDHDNKILIKESWINITERDQFQHYHIHAHNDISGVYYHEASGNQEQGNIVFKSPTSVAHNSKLFHFEPNQVYYAPIKGRLILFPSFLEHAVLSNKTDDKRISISFNIDIGHIRPKEKNKE